MYEATAALEPSLNGSVALPDYFYRNLGVAWSQLIRLEPHEESRAGAKQRAAAAFLRYLRFEGISTEDRTAIEQGLLSLIPTPGAPAGALEAQHAQQDAQRAVDAKRLADLCGQLLSTRRLPKQVESSSSRANGKNSNERRPTRKPKGRGSRSNSLIPEPKERKQRPSSAQSYLIVRKQAHVRRTGAWSVD